MSSHYKKLQRECEKLHTKRERKFSQLFEDIKSFKIFSLQCADVALAYYYYEVMEIMWKWKNIYDLESWKYFSRCGGGEKSPQKRMIYIMALNKRINWDKLESFTLHSAWNIDKLIELSDLDILKDDGVWKKSERISSSIESIHGNRKIHKRQLLLR